MPEHPPSYEISIARASLHYRRLWRAFLAVGLVSLAFLTPLIGNLALDLRFAGERPFGSKIAQIYSEDLSPVAVGAILIGLLLLFAVGRWSPRRVTVGAVLLAIGAMLDVQDDWILLWDVLDPGEWDSVTASVAITALIWVASALEALAALLVLRTLHPAASGPNILNLLTTFSTLARARMRREDKFRPFRLAWFLAAFALSGALAYALQYINAVWIRWHALGAPRYSTGQADFISWSEAHPYKAGIGVVSDLTQVVLTIAIFTFVFRFFRRLVGADAKKLLANPDYRPIVFLRSFVDDAAAVTSKRFTDRLVGRLRRLEEIAVRVLAPLGVAIAIGQPGERLPKLGAIRAYYADDEWQAAVLEWMQRAHLIAIVAGASHWTLWEFKQALDRGYTGKLLLLWPPDRDGAARRARWQSLADTAGGTSWERSMRLLEPAGVIATVLRPDGEVLAVRGNGRLQADYEAAVQLATVELLRPVPA